MDLRLGKLRQMRIDLQSDADIGLDLNTAEDLDMGGFSFAGSEEGDDLSGFMQERVGNYDYLDIDEEDLQTIPSPDVDASAVPEVERVLLQDYQKHARGDGSGNRVALEHHEHLREQRQAKAPDKERVLIEARKAMMAGIRGDALLHFLAAKFDKPHLQVAAKDLKTYTVDQHLLGNVILEPELFASCQEMEKFLKTRKVTPTAKFAKVCGDCRNCSYRSKSRCSKFATTLVNEMPNDRRVFEHYAGELGNSGRLPSKVASAVQEKTQDYRQATAALFAWVAQAPSTSRRESSAAVSNFALPERREVSQTPRDALIATVGKLLNTGARVDKVKSATLGYLGKVSFERVAREAMTRRGSMPWASFGSCSHPMLMDREASFTLEAGDRCAGCTHNYGDHCHFCKRAFSEPFLPEENKYDEVPELIGEDEEMFLDSTPEMDLSPSESDLPALELEDFEGLDEGFEV